MKHALLIMACSLCSLSMLAQVRLGIEGGFNLSRFVPTDRSAEPANDSYNTAWFRGGKIGLVTEAQLSHKLYLKSGFRINGKGTVMMPQTSIDTSKRYIEVYYAEVPLVLVYKSNLGRSRSIYGGFGLYAARAIRGVEWGKGRSFFGPYSMNSEIIFANENQYRAFPIVMKPFDWGGIAMAGYEYKRFQFSLDCEISNSSVLPNSKIYGLNFRNAEISLSAAYYIFNSNR